MSRSCARRQPSEAAWPIDSVAACRGSRAGRRPASPAGRCVWWPVSAIAQQPYGPPGRHLQLVGDGEAADRRRVARAADARPAAGAARGAARTASGARERSTWIESRWRRAAPPPRIQPCGRSAARREHRAASRARRPTTASTVGEPNSVRGRSARAPAAGRGAQHRAPEHAGRSASAPSATALGASGRAGPASPRRRSGGGAPARSSDASPPPQPARRRRGPAAGQQRGAARRATGAPRMRSQPELREHRRQTLAPPRLEADAPEHLVGQRQVVGAQVGPVVEDRAALLGRLGVGDRGADHRVEDLVAEVLLELRRRPRASARCACRRCSAARRATRGRGCRTRFACSMTSSAPSTPCSAKYCASEEISAQSAATRPLIVSRPSAGGQSMRMMSWLLRTSLSALRRTSSRPILPDSAALHLGQDRRTRARSRRARRPWPWRRPRRTSAIVGVASGGDVEVVGEVALRVEVDGEHVEPDPAQDVGQRSNSGGLARAALERQDGDRLGHGRATIATLAAAGSYSAATPAVGVWLATAVVSRNQIECRPTRISSPSASRLHSTLRPFT